MSNIREIPFTEIVERVQDLGRAGTDTRSRTRGIVNGVYTLDFPLIFDWPCLKASSAIGMIAEYNTGYASVLTQGSAVSFCSGATLDSSFIGRKIKFDNNPNVYDIIALLSTTGCTISPILAGESHVETGGYTIFRSIYALPSDFDRWPIKGGLCYFQGGQPTPLHELNDPEYYNLANASPSATPQGIRLLSKDTAGCTQFEIVPPPSSAYALLDEYIRELQPMRENSAGTAVFTSGSTIVTGTGTSFTRMNTGAFIRASAFGNGPDSEWYRISTIASDTDLTLTKVFRSDSSYSGSYVISDAPQIDSHFHEAIINGALRKILPDHKDYMWITANRDWATVMSDNKVLVKTRHGSESIELEAEDPDYRR